MLDCLIMHRHVVHFVLVFMLAIAPVQSAVAGLAALGHETKCEMGGHDMSMHEGMQHDQDESVASGGCECCDCSSLCLVLSTHVPAVLSDSPAMPYLATTQHGNLTPPTVNSQYPPTELRPPIVRL